MKKLLPSLSWALGAFCVLGGPASSSAQPVGGDVVYGPSEVERLQLQEMTRSSQANLKSLQDDSQVIKMNATGVGSVVTTGTTTILPAGQLGASFPNFIWADSQGVWKIDKFGKQCAVATSSGSSAGSDPCS